MQPLHLVPEALAVVGWVNDHYPDPPDNSSYVIWYYARSFWRYYPSILYESDREKIKDTLEAVFSDAHPPDGDKDWALAQFCLERTLIYLVSYCGTLGYATTVAVMRLQQVAKVTRIPAEVLMSHLEEVQTALGLLAEEQLVIELEYDMTSSVLGSRDSREAAQCKFKSFLELAVRLTECVTKGQYAEVGALTLLLHFHFAAGSPILFIDELLRVSGYPYRE